MQRRLLAVALLCCLVGLSALERAPAVAQTPEVAAAALPPEARATLALIQRGGPYPYRRDGAVFGNFERALPLRERGFYREYTVPTPDAHGRGARRIVVGGDGRTAGEYYYTDDHYRSFRRIRE